MKDDEDVVVFADYIIDSIEKEDFIYAVKRFIIYESNRLINRITILFYKFLY